MDTAQVGRAFTDVGQRLNGTPCRECRRRNTYAVIYQAVVFVACEDCGCSTRMGRVTGTG